MRRDGQKKSGKTPREGDQYLPEVPILSTNKRNLLEKLKKLYNIDICASCFPNYSPAVPYVPEEQADPMHT